MKTLKNKWRTIISVVLEILCVIVILLMLFLPRMTSTIPNEPKNSSLQSTESSDNKINSVEESSASQTSSENTSISSSNENSNSSKPVESSDSNSSSDIPNDDSSLLNEEYKKPSIPSDIDKNKIIHTFQTHLGERQIIEYKNFILEYFNNKVYNPGDIIDCKADIAKLGKNSSEYYKVFSTVYSDWNFSTLPRMFGEEDVNFDPFTNMYELSDTTNLILKYSGDEKITLRVYCDEEHAYFIIISN